MKQFLMAALLAGAVHTPALAAELAIGMKGGLLEGEPATSIYLDVHEPGSPLHVQPRLGFWADKGQPGIWEVGVDALVHRMPCSSTAPYLGFGLGAEWLPAVPAPAPDPPPQAIPLPGEEPPVVPPPVDPPSPIAAIIGGLRFPGERFDLFLEGRITMRHGEPRRGVMIGLSFHELRPRPQGRQSGAPPAREHVHRGRAR